MTKHPRNTCVGEKVEDLLVATGERLQKAAEGEVLAVWQEFVRCARAHLDQAEREYGKCEDRRQSAAGARDDLQDEVADLRRSLRTSEADAVFLDRYFADELTGEDLARCWASGWPVPERRRASA